MFGNAQGLNNMPKTFHACGDLWTPRRANRGSYTLAGNTVLYRGVEYFYIRFWGHTIAEIYPTHTRLFACGYDTSPTTIGRLNSFTHARIGNDNRKGYKDTLRINGYPFFEGVRVLPNGAIHPDDIRSDFYTRPKKEVVSAYVKLWRWISNNLRGRHAIGEWKESISHATFPIYAAQDLMNEGKTFLPHEWGAAIFMVDGDTIGSRRHRHTVEGFDECIQIARDSLRHEYYRAHDGYETIEVPNAAH